MTIRLDVWRAARLSDDPGIPSFWQFRTVVESAEARAALPYTIDMTKVRYFELR